MTTSVAVIGLTFKSTDIQTIGGIFLHTILRGGPGDTSQVRGVDWTVPQLDGRQEGNRVYDYRPITLRGSVAGDGADEAAQRQDFRENCIALADLFNPIDIGELVATLPGGAMYSINARPLPSILYTEVVPAYADPVTIELESLDPNWTAVGS